MGKHANQGVYAFVAWSIAVLVSLLSLTLIAITVLGWLGLGG
jgi:hypothetical protein